MSVRTKMRRKSLTNLANKLRSPPPQVTDSLEPDPKKDLDLPLKDVNHKGLRKAFKRIQKMSGGDLGSLLTEGDEYIMNYVLEQIPVIKKLQSERDDLRKQVLDLANYNYAREPEFVRQRLKLRETLETVDSVRRRIASRQVEPVLNKLNQSQTLLTNQARDSEEESERLAQAYLEGNKQHDEFIEEYLNIRKTTNHKRILADSLSKELYKLNLNKPQQCEYDSPIPTPRQRKKNSPQKVE